MRSRLSSEFLIQKPIERQSGPFKSVSDPVGSESLPPDDECCAEDGLPSASSLQKQSGKQEHQNHAELVNGGNLRGFAELEPRESSTAMRRRWQSLKGQETARHLPLSCEMLLVRPEKITMPQVKQTTTVGSQRRRDI